MNFELIQMNQAQFMEYSQFSYRNYIDECMLYSNQGREELEEKLGNGVIKRTQNDLWYLVKANEVIIGYIWIQITPEKNDAFYYDVYLNSDARGKGHGRKLMESTQEILVKRGIKVLRLSVFQSNIVARKLYESLGYYIVKENHEGGTYRMQKDLL
jgi:ribosomal protein S18 acetylase RimI-like enzyme